MVEPRGQKPQQNRSQRGVRAGGAGWEPVCEHRAFVLSEMTEYRGFKQGTEGGLTAMLRASRWGASKVPLTGLRAPSLPWPPGL